VLITQNDACCRHTSLAEAGFGPAQRAQKALDEETERGADVDRAWPI
jgi:hypothetical protein